MELVREAARSRGPAGLLAPFNEDMVRQVLEEVRTLWERNRAEVGATKAISPAVSLRHAAIERNRRCLLAYINHRCP